MLLPIYHDKLECLASMLALLWHDKLECSTPKWKCCLVKINYSVWHKHVSAILASKARPDELLCLSPTC